VQQALLRPEPPVRQRQERLALQRRQERLALLLEQALPAWLA
jgi:hypothetical protein